MNDWKRGNTLSVLTEWDNCICRSRREIGREEKCNETEQENKSERKST